MGLSRADYARSSIGTNNTPCRVARPFIRDEGARAGLLTTRSWRLPLDRRSDRDIRKNQGDYDKHGDENGRDDHCTDFDNFRNLEPPDEGGEPIPHHTAPFKEPRRGKQKPSEAFSSGGSVCTDVWVR